MNYDPNTGQPINNVQQQPVVEKQTNVLAIVALILSILGFTIISLIMGIIALKKSKELNSGKVLSIIAIINSILETIALVLIFALGTVFSSLVWPSVRENIKQSAYCSMAYDCEMVNKSEYSCKYKDENNNEQIITCPWTDVSNGQYKETTTTTTVVRNNPSISDIKVASLKKFAELGSNFKDRYEASDYGIIVNDSSFKKLDNFYLDVDDCTPTGTNNKNGLNVSYTCKKDSGDEDQYYGWLYDITVNNKFHIKASESTCGAPLYYFGENKYILLYTSCAVTGAHLSIRDANNNVIYENEEIAYPSFNQEENYIDFITGEYSSYYINPYIENNKLYFVSSDDPIADRGNKDCYTMEYDLLTDKLNKIDTFKCNYSSGD